MQVFIPYSSPIKVAKCLDFRRLNKQILECRQIIRAINGETSAWASHPIVKMYKNEVGWLNLYLLCLEAYRDGKQETAINLSKLADKYKPSWMTEALCNSHKRRLVAKDREFYKKFYHYGISGINYYIIDGKVLGYMNGKCIITQTTEEFNNGKA